MVSCIVERDVEEVDGVMGEGEEGEEREKGEDGEKGEGVVLAVLVDTYTAEYGEL